jgi:hypothetical protein
MFWQSIPLEGVIQGTPVVNTNQNHHEMKYIFVPRNTKTIKFDNSTGTSGHLTMLRAATGEVVWEQSETELQGNDGFDGTLGYGPLAIAQSTNLGKYNGGENNQNDMIVWASSSDDGYGKSGYTFGFQLPSSFEQTDVQVQGLGSVVLKSVRWTTITSPTLTKNGKDLFFSVTGGELRGWVRNRSFGETANWSFKEFENNHDPEAREYDLYNYLFFLLKSI